MPWKLASIRINRNFDSWVLEEALLIMTYLNNFTHIWQMVRYSNYPRLFLQSNMNTLRYQFNPLSGKAHCKARIRTNQFIITVHEDYERTKEIRHEEDMAEMPTELNLNLNLDFFVCFNVCLVLFTFFASFYTIKKLEFAL